LAFLRSPGKGTGQRIKKQDRIRKSGEKEAVKRIEEAKEEAS
jgi:hypothetical protein